MTGRQDWVSSTSEPDSFINRGQRLLDVLQETPHSKVRILGHIFPRDGLITLDDTRVIKAIYIWSNGSRVKLEKHSLDEIYEAYPDYLPAVLDADLITNGTFDSGSSNWTLGTGWSYGANRLTKVAGSASSVDQTLSTSAVAGKYRVSVSVTSYLAGSVSAQLGTVSSGAMSGGGFQSKEITTTSSTSSFSIVATSDFAGNVDNVKLERIVSDGAGTLGQPLYYTPNVVSRSATQKGYDFSYFEGSSGWQDSRAGDLYGKMGILIYPAADLVYPYTMLVEGQSPVLVNDTDTSYWTELYPEILATAATYHYELYFRNNEGAAMIMRNLRQMLGNIDRDMADQDAVGVDAMEG